MALPSKSSHDPPCQNTGESKRSLQVEEEKFGRASENFKPNTGINTKSPSSRNTKSPFIQELQYFFKRQHLEAIYLPTFFHREKAGFQFPVNLRKLQYIQMTQLHAVIGMPVYEK